MEFKIGKTNVGGENPVFIVAEIGINFDGSYEKALKLIDVATKAGCNAVKFQMFKAATMYLEGTGEDKSGDGRKKDIYKIVEDSELPEEWIPKLKRYANKKGLEFFLTTCDEKDTDVLEKYKVPAYKIASYEITHIPLLRHTAKKKKPIIFSSGDATLLEISEALEVFKQENNHHIVLNHCIGNYPAPLESLNLNVIKMFNLAFPNIVIGYSDHSVDPVIAPKAAVALGAKVIEKHITLNKNSPGPDHIFALEPKELSLMVKTIRDTEKRIKKGEVIKIDKKVLGTSEKKVYSKKEQMTRDFGFRTIFARKNIKKGEIFTRHNLIVLRPGNEKRGLHPRYFEVILKGYRATKNIKANQFWFYYFIIR